MAKLRSTDVNGNLFVSGQLKLTNPFLISTNTLITNLNADLLDGYHANDLIVRSTKCYDTSSSDTANGNWTVTIPGITELTEGLTIKIRIKRAGASTCKLNLNGLGAKTVYLRYGSKLTTHYAKESVLALTYTGDAIGSGTDRTGWIVENYYDTIDIGELIAYYSRYPVKNTLYKFQICFVNKDEQLIPVYYGGDNDVSANKTLTTESFMPEKGIFYYKSYTVIQPGSYPVEGSLSIQAYLADLRYSFNTAQTLTAGKPVYLVVTPQSDGQVKLASTPITQALPTTQNSNYYIYLGQAYDTYRISFISFHPIFKWNKKTSSFTTDSVEASDSISSLNTSVTTLNSYFTNGIAKKATADASGNVITNTYVKKAGDTMTGGLSPATNKGASLGTSSLYWNNIYGTTLYENGTALTNKYASKTNLPEAYLTWGGRNLSNSYGPIDAAMVPALGANRLAFAPAAAIEVEYSRDNGATWTDYGLNNTQKTAIFSGPRVGTSVVIGKPGSKNTSTGVYDNASVNNRARITISTDTANIYTVLNKIIIYCSTEGSGGCKCTIDGQTKANYDSGNDTWTTFANEIPIEGWSGYNVINVSGIVTYGGYSNQYVKLRFTFYCTDAGTMATSGGLTIYNIYGFGGVGWREPSNMAVWGQIYTYDANQNVTFPGDITSSTLNTYNIYPRANKGYNLGKSSAYWNNIYGTTIYENGTALTDKYVKKAGDTMSGTLTPSTNKGASLGSSSLYWNNVYGTTIYENGTSLADKYVKKTGDTMSGTLTPATNKGASLGSSSLYWNNIYGTTIYENGAALTNKYAPKSHTHDKSEVGLGNVDNTSDANKSVKYATTAGTTDYFKYGRGVMLADSTSFTNNFNKDIFGEETADKFHLVELRTQGNAPSCLIGTHSSGIAWKGADTYGSLMVRWGYPQIRVSGGNGNNTNPKWTVDLIHSNNISSESIKYASSGLGRYDTISENSDGTYTINRQTGYILLDGVIEKNASVTQNGSTSTYRYTFDIVNGYGADGPVISNLLTNISFSDLSNNGRTGIAMYSATRCSICISGITTLADYKSHLAKNNIYVQYKLATTRTEKVEKNHYARYNERFILEHNKSEAERSANLLNTFDRSNINSSSSLYAATLNSDGSYTTNVSSDSRSWDYPNTDFKLHLTKGTYSFSITGKTISSDPNTGMRVIASNDTTLCTAHSGNGYKSSFTLTSDTDIGVLIKSYNSTDLKIMLNKGSVALPYQPYEGKVVHEKDLKNVSTSLGYYDEVTENSDGTYTITRQTGYVTINAEDITSGSNETVNKANAYAYVYNNNKISDALYEWEAIIGISNNGFEVKCVDAAWVKANKISINSTQKKICIGFETAKTQAEIQALCPIYVQYKLATTRTEKVEKNHYARYNERFILEHNKSEAERSANLTYTTSIRSTAIRYDNCITLAPFDYKKGVTYTLSFDTENTGSMLYLDNYADLGLNYMAVFAGGTRKTFTFTPTKDTLNYTLRVSKNGDDGLFTGTCSNVMLNLGSVALPYQPYNQNKHITNNEAVFLKNEAEKSANLVDYSNVQLGKNFESNQNAIVDNNKTSLVLVNSIKPNTTYYFSSETVCEVYAFYELNDTNFVKSNLFNNVKNGSFTTSSTTNRIVAAWFKDSSTTLPNVSNLMLNEGSVALPYQPYEGKVIHEKDLKNNSSNYVTLGYYDTITENSDGTYTITRQTGFRNISIDLIKNGGYRPTQNGHGEYGADTGIHNLPIASGSKNFINNLLSVRDNGEVYAGSTGISITENGSCWVNLGDDYTTPEQYREYFSKNSIYVQYKLVKATTEKVEKNHYARYNERFILEHNKNEAEKSANLWSYEKSITINAGNDHWWYASNETLLHWGLVIGEKYSIKAFTDDSTKDLSFQILPSWSDFKTNKTFVFTSNTSIRIGGNTVASPVTFTPKITLIKGSDILYEYQPYEGKVLHEKDLKKVSTSLGYYDEVAENADGTYSITRQTGYLTINSEDITSGSNETVNSANAYIYVYYNNKISGALYDWDAIIGISNNGFEVKCVDSSWTGANKISINSTGKQICIGFETAKTQAAIQAMCPIYVQYKLATATTEIVEKNHYARYNQRFILEHNKTEAGEAANLFDLSNIATGTDLVDPEIIFNYESGGIIIPYGTVEGDNDLQLQRWNNNDYVSFMGTFNEGFNSITFQKTSDFNLIRIKRNGRSGTGRDLGAAFNVNYLEDGKTYTISAQVHNNSSNKTFYCRYIMIVEGTKDVTEYYHYNAKKYITNNEALFLKTETNRTVNLVNTFDRSNIPNNSSLYTATLNSDGSYTSKADSDSRTWAYAYSDFKLHLTKGTYTFSVTGTPISSREFTQMKIFDSNNKTLCTLFKEENFKEKSFALTSDADIGILIKSYDSTNLKIMLNKGLVALPYQPFEGKVIHKKDLDNLPKLYNHFLKISFTKERVTYNCRVNILSTVRTAIASFDTFARVCREAKNIFETSSSNYYYWSMPAEGSNDNGSYSDNYIIFRLFLYFDYAGEKIIYLYNINKTNSANNFSVANSVGADISFSDTVTTIYGGK